MQFPDSGFWNFSISFYPLPDIEQSCLQLQDNFELNVNLVLFCHWLAIEKQQPLDSNQWQQLIVTTQPWEEILKPLRESRRMIKHHPIAWPSDFKQETSNGVSNIEINTEHMQQLAIEQAWQQMNTASSDESCENIINHNIKYYLIATNSSFSADAISAETETLLKASLGFQANNQTIAL